MAPPSMESSSSGITSSGSTSNLVPRPEHAPAGAVGAVEGKGTGLQLLERQPAVVAGQVLAEGQLGAVDDVHHRDPAGETQGGLQRFGQPPDPAPARYQPVDHHLDGVDEVAVQADPFPQVHDLAVHPGPAVTLPGQVAEQLLVFPLAAPDHGGQHLEAGAFLEAGDLVDDLLGGLAGHFPAAFRAVGLSDPGVEQAQVVVDLRDGAHRGSGVAAGGLLVDGDGRRQAFDEIHIGLVHLAEELPGVGRQALHVTALALGVDGVERQAGLARSGQPGEHDQPIAGKLDGYVLEVVLAGSANDQFVSRHLARVSIAGEAWRRANCSEPCGASRRGRRPPFRSSYTYVCSYHTPRNWRGRGI